MNELEIQDALTLVQEAGDNRRIARREALMKALTGGAIIAAGIALPALALPKRALAQTQAVTDIDILNFTLNFEYLEAEYYTLGTTGRPIESLGIATTGSGTAGSINVRSNPQVTFSTTAIRQLMEEVAADERAHVAYVRSVISGLGGAFIARPAIDYTGAFNAAAVAAGIGTSFDPFANEVNFLLGGFTFSDVTITALKGASPLIQNKDVLDGAAGILGVEGYHIGGLRLKIFQAGAEAQANAQKISDLRDTLDGAVLIADKDQGVTLNGTANLVPTDADSLVFSRNFSEVLHIAYANAAPGVSSGGFFPAGVNGNIRVAA